MQYTFDEVNAQGFVPKEGDFYIAQNGQTMTWNEVTQEWDPGAIETTETTTTPAGTTTPWGDWSRVFGEYSPQAQYTSLMTSGLPQYYMPRYSQMAQRQFDPTFGRFLLGGYGADTTTGGVTSYADPVSKGLGTGEQFSDWYTGQGNIAGVPPTNLLGTNIQQGYNRALQFGGLNPMSTDWNQLSAAPGGLGMAYAMQQPDAVRAMAMSRLYGGGGPTGGYAGRAQASSMGNLYDDYMARGAQRGITGPSGFLPYLANLSPTRFGGYS